MSALLCLITLLPPSQFWPAPAYYWPMMPQMAPPLRGFAPGFVRRPLPPAGLTGSFFAFPQHVAAGQELQPWQQAQVAFRHLIDTSRLPPPQPMQNLATPAVATSSPSSHSSNTNTITTTTTTTITTASSSSSSSNNVSAIAPATQSSWLGGGNLTTEGFQKQVGQLVEQHWPAMTYSNASNETQSRSFTAWAEKWPSLAQFRLNFAAAQSNLPKELRKDPGHYNSINDLVALTCGFMFVSLFYYWGAAMVASLSFLF